MTPEHAIALAREIGEALGGEQREALELLVRMATRGRRPSEQIEAVRHFEAARAELAEGKKKASDED